MNSAINLAINNHFAFSQLFTLGGLKVDEDSGKWIDQAGEPISGLYAAGRAPRLDFTAPWCSAGKPVEVGAG